MRKYECLRLEKADGGYILRYDENYKPSGSSPNDNICRSYGKEKIYTDGIAAITDMEKMYKTEIDETGREIMGHSAEENGEDS